MTNAIWKCFTFFALSLLNFDRIPKIQIDGHCHLTSQLIPRNTTIQTYCYYKLIDLHVYTVRCNSMNSVGYIIVHNTKCIVVKTLQQLGIYIYI